MDTSIVFILALILSILFMFLNAWIWLHTKQVAWLSALSAVVLFLVSFVLGVWLSVAKFEGRIGGLW